MDRKIYNTGMGYGPYLNLKPVRKKNMTSAITSVSKFMSKILRHSPSQYGLTMQGGGWVDLDDLLEVLKKESNFNVNNEVIDNIVKNDDKGRYSYNKDQTLIRANWGHSVPVDLDIEPAIPPDILYHGTKEQFIPSISKDGISKMNRNYVHLSKHKDMAQNVAGRRQGKNVILEIDAMEMWKAGHKFYCSDNELLWLTDHVPMKYVIIL